MRSAGVTSTPAFFVSGVYLGGVQPLGTFEKVIRRGLAMKQFLR